MGRPLAAPRRHQPSG